MQVRAFERYIPLTSLEDRRQHGNLIEVYNIILVDKKMWKKIKMADRNFEGNKIAFKRSYDKQNLSLAIISCKMYLTHQRLV